MSLFVLFSKLKGGAGSGNKGHAGIPGHRGGSLPKGGGAEKAAAIEIVKGLSVLMDNFKIPEDALNEIFTDGRYDHPAIDETKALIK